MKYINFEQDGVRQAFPVSRHVLRVGTPLQAIRAWRPSLLQQGASFALMLALSASSYGLTYGHLDNTLAYFRDYEVSRNNVLQAGSLDFVVTPESDAAALIEMGAHVTVPVMTPEPGSFPTMYRVTATTTATTTPLLCTALVANASSSPFAYSGPLLGLSVVATTTTGAWPLTISLPDSAGLTEGDECVVDIVYSGWHEDMPENTGYTDEERFTIALTYAPTVLLLDFTPNALLMQMEISGEAKDAPQDTEEPGEVPELDEPTPPGGGGGGGTEPPVPPEETPPAPEETPAEPEEVVDEPETIDGTEETPAPEETLEEETPAEEPAQTEEPKQEETPPVETPPIEPEPSVPPADTEQAPVETNEGQE